MDKLLFKDKERVSIFIDPKLKKVLKKKAVDLDLSLSDFLVLAARLYPHFNK